MRLLPLGGQSGTPTATTTAMNVVPRTVKQPVPLRHRARFLPRWRGALLAWLCIVAAPWLASAGTLAQFRTPIGTLDVELYDQDKPITVRNFIRYVQAGAYTNMFLHRWVPGFVIQGGGYFVTNRFTAPSIPNVRAFAPILNEYNGDARFSNLYGTIAMAKLGGDPNSATSQWFFNLANNAANLDTQNGGFTVFGRVIGGTNVLNRFNSTTTTNGVFSKNIDNGALSQLPVLNAQPSYDDLIYVDISLLNVRVSATNGTRFITWNSVSNRLNTVEYTTVFPPVWQSLTNLTGNGTDRVFADLAADSARRFYRVRVDY